MTEKYVKRLY